MKEKEKGKASQSPWFLMILQVAGMGICAWLKYCDITPMADAMGRSSRWDFTADMVGFFLIFVPALVACVKKPSGWTLPVALASLPVVLMVCAFAYFVAINQMNALKAKKERMTRYDSAAKVEQVIGMPFPEFEITEYNEKVMDESPILAYICKSRAKFKEKPCNAFFDKLDSLCSLQGTNWHRGEDTYLFDSMRANVLNKVLVLSLLITKGRDDIYMEYDVSPELSVIIKNN